MREIKKVAVLGGGGNMGSRSGGIFAQADIPCIYFDVTVERAQAGIETAVQEARSEVVRRYLKACSYAELEKEMVDCDWIFEALPEDMAIKTEFFKRIDKIRKPTSIVSTVTSGLSIHQMAEGCSEDFQKHFMGTHFYNPPSKLPANELIFHRKVSKELSSFVANFCEKTLRRVNIVTLDTPAFAGNRIGFQFLNEAAIYAEKYGVAMIDYLLGPYTGRAMPPLATIDLVGLDVHKAIVDNVCHHVKDERSDSYKMPSYMQKMIDLGMLGRKARGKGGFFSRDENKNKLVLDLKTWQLLPEEKIKLDWVEKIKDHIHDGRYAAAIEILKTAPGQEADLVRHFLLGYISYSFHRIGEVTPLEDGIHGIDLVMSTGFSWLPPSGWVDLLGGPRATIALMEKAGLPVPTTLANLPEQKICRIREITKFLIAG